MHTPNRRHSTETGKLPRYEPAAPREGEPPLKMPEVGEPQAMTGVIQIVSEGVDDSRDADDSV